MADIHIGEQPSATVLFSPLAQGNPAGVLFQRVPTVADRAAIGDFLQRWVLIADTVDHHRRAGVVRQDLWLTTTAMTPPRNTTSDPSGLDNPRASPCRTSRWRMACAVTSVERRLALPVGSATKTNFANAWMPSKATRIVVLVSSTGSPFRRWWQTDTSSRLTPTKTCRCRLAR